jgi:hypothetical protein
MAGLGPVGLAYRIARPLLFRFDAERIHDRTLRALRFAGQNLIGRGLLGIAGSAPASGPGTEVAGMPSPGGPRSVSGSLRSGR